MKRFLLVVFLVCGILRLASGNPESHLFSPSNQSTASSSSLPDVLVASYELTQIKQCSRLTDALALLHDKQGLCFVAEGRPYRDMANPESPLSRLPWRTDSPLRLTKVVEDVAQAYDYKVAFSGSIILLGKRYGHPDDQAEVTFGEMKRFLQSASQVCRLFATDFPLRSGRSSA